MRVTDDHRADSSAPGQWIALGRRRPRHLQHHRPPLGHSRRCRSSPHRPGDGPAGRPSFWRTVSVDGGQLPGREHRQHGRDHPRRAGARLAALAGAAEPAGRRATGRSVTSPGGPSRARTCPWPKRLRYDARSPPRLGPSAYWYLARSTGRGRARAAERRAWSSASSAPSASPPPRGGPGSRSTPCTATSPLLVVALIVIHVITSVLDGFAPISLIDGVIPFRSRLPLALARSSGRCPSTYCIALVVTSLVRRRLGYRTWRAVHWLAYASWPIAVLHGLGHGYRRQIGVVAPAHRWPAWPLSWSRWGCACAPPRRPRRPRRGDRPGHRRSDRTRRVRDPGPAAKGLGAPGGDAGSPARAARTGSAARRETPTLSPTSRPRRRARWCTLSRPTCRGRSSRPRRPGAPSRAWAAPERRRLAGSSACGWAAPRWTAAVSRSTGSQVDLTGPGLRAGPGREDRLAGQQPGPGPGVRLRGQCHAAPSRADRSTRAPAP